MEGKKCARNDVRQIESVEDRFEGAGAAGGPAAVTIVTLAFFVLAGAVGPLEDEREDDGFDAGGERADTKIDVVVGHFRRGTEELAIQDAEKDLHDVSRVRAFKSF